MPKKSKEVVKQKPAEAEKPEVKKKDEAFSTDNPNTTAELTQKGFHVKAQTVLDGRMVYTFKESKSEIEKVL